MPGPGLPVIAAGVGVAAALGGGAMSFAQAGKARRQAEDAQRKSEKLMREARDRATKNVYDKLQVPLDAFGEQYRQGLATQTQQVQALQEGDARGLAAGIGKAFVVLGLEHLGLIKFLALFVSQHHHRLDNPLTKIYPFCL